MKVSSTSAPIEFWGAGVDADDVWFRSHESVIHAPRAPVVEISSKSGFSLADVCTHLV